MNLLERITVNPEICHGKPCVRGMRWPVEIILDMLGSSMTKEEIIADHPELEMEDFQACADFVRLLLRGHSVSELVR